MNPINPISNQTTNPQIQPTKPPGKMTSLVNRILSALHMPCCHHPSIKQKKQEKENQLLLSAVESIYKGSLKKEAVLSSIGQKLKYTQGVPDQFSRDANRSNSTITVKGKEFKLVSRSGSTEELADPVKKFYHDISEAIQDEELTKTTALLTTQSILNDINIAILPKMIQLTTQYRDLKVDQWQTEIQVVDKKIDVKYAAVVSNKGTPLADMNIRFTLTKEEQGFSCTDPSFNFIVEAR